MYWRVVKTVVGVTVVSLSLMASSCGDGEPRSLNTGGKTNVSPDAPTTITSFVVTGTSVDTDNVELIGGATTGAYNFDLSWDVSSSPTYSYRVLLSADNSLSVDDVQIFSGSCTNGGACETSADFSCTFDDTTTIYSISCNGLSPVNISTVLTTPSPQVAYIFLGVNNANMTSQATLSRRVRFTGY